MLNIVLFGPPGSGKGTQAKILSEKFQLKHISTGDLLRQEKKDGTSLGLEAKKYMDAGELVPDEVVIGMISNCLDSYANNVKGFIFDGFPRTVAQAEALDNLLSNKALNISGVLALTVDDDEIVARLLNRGKTSGRADDTDEDTIRKRINVYKGETSPVANYYASQNKFVELEGVGDIGKISKTLSAAVEALI